MSKLEQSAFFYPEQSSKTSSKSPSDLVNQQVRESEKQNNFVLNLTEGKANMREPFTTVAPNSYGRTLNVPKVLPPGQIPGPSFNNALYVGEKCRGIHCGLAVDPTVTSYISKLHSLPGSARYHFQSMNRPGNNTENLPWLKTYTGTAINYGPYAFEVVPDSYSEYASF